VPISRYADPALPSGGLTTSVVAVVTDAVRNGRPVVGYGFSSFGRFAQSGLIRERFAPRLIGTDLEGPAGDLDPFRAWQVMMAGEKPGGHGERCVAVGTLDMALWDAAAKAAGLPLYRQVARSLGVALPVGETIAAYAGGGYYYPHDDGVRLREEIRDFVDRGFTHVKIKIGGASLARDLARIEAALELLPSGAHLAVDAMNAYDAALAGGAAEAFEPYGLWWFEDVCDPLDFETLATVAQRYRHPIAAGEAIFSEAEAKLLDRYGGLRRERDVLLFDPVHCYGLPGFLQIVRTLEGRGWPRSAFWPHGGHAYTSHVVRALGLGGAEVNPRCFAPFGGGVQDWERPGIGFEADPAAIALFQALG